MKSCNSKWYAVLILALTATALAQQTAAPRKKSASSSSHAAKAAPGNPVSRKAGGAKSRAAHGHAPTEKTHAGARKPVQVKATPESRKLTLAFTASVQLRPMAQQLSATRSAAAYAGVQQYAAAHPGEAAAAAELALGHAYMLDHRFGDAENAFRQASQQGEVLDDYAVYLGAQAAVQGNRPGDAAGLLTGFSDRFPGSLFVPNVPVLLANAYLENHDASSALRVLQPLQSQPAGAHADFRFTLAKAYQASGNAEQAGALYRGIYVGDPLSSDAAPAVTQLAALGVPLTVAERKQHADAMYNAKHYDIAGQEYRALKKNDSGLSQADRDALEIYAAVCDLKLKKLGRGDVERLPATGDDSAALKLYLRSELARNEGKTGEHDELVAQMLTQYPQSRWLEEALDSGGNMYLVKRDRERAVEEYTQLFAHFPRSVYAPAAHWHAAWLSYRLRHYPEAAKLMDEQITSFPAGTEIPAALYWRARLYEDIEHNIPQASNYYKELNAAYVNSYYAILGRQRLAVLGAQESVDPAPALASVRPVDDPHLTDALPENDPHLIKARLLANASLNEYIRPEIQLSDTSAQWGALAESEIYQSFGENTRALQTMKHSGPQFFSLPVNDVPMVYWQLLFPRPYWQDLTANATANGLDPYLVASLIRQESEFNPEAVSRANAYGLMQLLPSVGKTIAKREGDKHFSVNELFNPAINLQLGEHDLRQSIDRFGGQLEYALASYNAGDTPVRLWMAENDYKDVAEWVESIPYTETREYVQSILRNREMYRAIYGVQASGPVSDGSQ